MTDELRPVRGKQALKPVKLIKIPNKNHNYHFIWALPPTRAFFIGRTCYAKFCNTLQESSSKVIPIKLVRRLGHRLKPCLLEQMVTRDTPE